MVHAGAQIEGHRAKRRKKIFAGAGDGYAEVEPGGQVAAGQLRFLAVPARIAAVDAPPVVSRIERRGHSARRQQTQFADERRQRSHGVRFAAGEREAAIGDRRQRAGDIDKTR